MNKDNSASKYICVYCGSSSGSNAQYTEAANLLGNELTRRDYGLIYGGGRIGLMGTIADAVLKEGGEVIGVIPEDLQKREVAHSRLTDLHVVDSMHARKALMADLADAFIALPGGIGTFEELFEIITWAQLGYHEKPIGLLNVDGYYTPLLEFLERTVDQGFMRTPVPELVSVNTDAGKLLESFEGILV